MTASLLVSPGICSRALCQPHTLLVHRSPLTTVSPPSATASSNCASLSWSGDGTMAEISSWASILIKMGVVESGKVLTFSLSSERTRGSCVLPHSRREKSCDPETWQWLNSCNSNLDTHGIVGLTTVSPSWLTARHHTSP